MPTSFENLYMSHSMHELFNKSTAPAAADRAALAVRPEAAAAQFTLEAMMAASDSYSITAQDLSRYANH